MIILEWETEHSPFGKDKDSITSLHATVLMETSITFKITTTLKILKVFGHMFTIHTVMTRTKQLVLLSMEIKISNQSNMIQLMPPPNSLDSFWEVMMPADILDSMVFSQQ